jgi:hypothetical protein
VRQLGLFFKRRLIAFFSKRMFHLSDIIIRLAWLLQLQRACWFTPVC